MSEKFNEKNHAVKRLLYEFEKVKKKVNRLSSVKWEEDCNNVALQHLDRAIEEQAKLQETVFEEGSDHYKLCFQKILFLEEIGRHEMAFEYSQEIVKKYEDYPNILLDAADYYCTIGEYDRAKDYRESYIELDEED